MKLPVFFFSFWLPKAHVEAPTTSRILLAGVLLKLGGFGLYRFASFFSCLEVVGWLFFGVRGCLLSPLMPSYQRDTKRYAAWSSVVHMGFVFILFLVCGGRASLGAALLLTHGYLSALLFYFIGEVYHSFGSRVLYFFKGVSSLGVFWGVSFC